MRNHSNGLIGIHVNRSSVDLFDVLLQYLSAGTEKNHVERKQTHTASMKKCKWTTGKTRDSAEDIAELAS